MGEENKDKSDKSKDSRLLILAAIAGKIKIWLYLFSEFAMAAIILLFLVIVGYPIAIILILGHPVPKPADPNEMPEDCRDLFIMFSEKSYGEVVIWNVYNDENRGVKQICFNHETRNPAVVKKVVEDLTGYYSENCSESPLGKCDIEFHEYEYDSCPLTCNVQNYVDKSNSISCPEWQDYENEDYEKWWVFDVYAADWKELEDNLTFAEGVCCRMEDCSGISEANPDLWTNLKYIRIVYYGEDADVYEQELKELFPNTEVYIRAE